MIAAGVVNNNYFKSEVFEEEKPAHILAATLNTVAKAAKAVVKVEEKERIVWKLNKTDGTLVTCKLTDDVNKGFSKKGAIMMRPKTFITKTERDDFGHLKRDISDGKIGW